MTQRDLLLAPLNRGHVFYGWQVAAPKVMHTFTDRISFGVAGHACRRLEADRGEGSRLYSGPNGRTREVANVLVQLLRAAENRIA